MPLAIFEENVMYKVNREVFKKNFLLPIENFLLYFITNCCWFNN